MRYQDFLKLYFGLVVLHLAVIYRPESAALFYISKPALLFSLLSFFIHRSSAWSSGLRFTFSLALIFSLIGDVVLMFKGELFFLTGMAAFAAAHTAYIIFYIRQKMPINWIGFLVSLVFSLLAILAMYLFIETPAELAPFLYLYAAIIGVHLVMSTRFRRTGISSSAWPAWGAVLFITSDFLLALDLFNFPNTWLRMGVMLSYALAQYLIVIGVLKTFDRQQ